MTPTAAATVGRRQRRQHHPQRRSGPPRHAEERRRLPDLNGNDVCDSGGTRIQRHRRWQVQPVHHGLPGCGGAPIASPSRPVTRPRFLQTAIDSHNPAVAATDADYVLKRLAGLGGAINPLTTLAQGRAWPPADRSGCARQRRAATADRCRQIDNYQDDPAWDDAQVRDTARTAAAVVSGMLRQGIALEVDQQAASTSIDHLAPTELQRIGRLLPGHR